MKTTATACVAFVAVASAAFGQAPPRDVRPAAVVATAVIRGRVVASDTNRPISLATITASAPQLREARSISTDSEGRYELRHLPAGRYTLSVSRSGYLKLQYGQRRVFELGTPLDVAAGQTVSGVDFLLPRMSVISGRIVDEEGEPLANVRVSAIQSPALGGAAIAQTDDSGGYRLTGLSPGTYRIQADPPGSWTSRDDGVVRTHGYAPTYFPGVASAAAARLVSVGLGEEAGSADFAIMPARLATITGTVIDSRGQPLANGPIEIATEITGGVGIRSGTRTGDDGSFTIPNLTPGPITLIAGTPLGPRAPAIPEAAIESVAVDGADISLLLTTSTGWSASGRIVGADGPLPAEIRSRLTAGSIPVVNALMGIRLNNVGGPEVGRVKDDGTFLVSGILGPVRLSLFGVPDGWGVKEILHNGRNISGQPLEARTGEVISDVQIVLSNRITSVSGQVTDAGGAPSAAGTVLVFAEDAARWFLQSRFIRALRPNPAGRFEITGLPPADYLAVAVEYATERMWRDPEYLESLRANAIKFSLAEGESKTVPLKLVTP